MKKYRLSARQKIFLILCLTTVFDISLILYRNWRIGFEWENIHSIYDLANYRSVTFFFLIWNLFLAWVPYWVSIAVNWLDQQKMPRFIIGIGVMIWLLFFPNAPYIITDFLHLKARPPIPMWYDLLLLFSFAWTGLILAFLSLMEMQSMLSRYTSKWVTWILSFTALALSGFGIFIGRFQRWNSWDIITQPYALFADVFEIMNSPLANLRTLGMAIVLSIMLVLGYATLMLLPNQKSN